MGLSVNILIHLTYHHTIGVVTASVSIFNIVSPADSRVSTKWAESPLILDKAICAKQFYIAFFCNQSVDRHNKRKACKCSYSTSGKKSSTPSKTTGHHRHHLSISVGPLVDRSNWAFNCISIILSEWSSQALFKKKVDYSWVKTFLLYSFNEMNI